MGSKYDGIQFTVTFPGSSFSLEFIFDLFKQIACGRLCMLYRHEVIIINFSHPW